MLDLRFEQSEIARFGRRIARLRIKQDETAPSPAEIGALCRAEGVEMLTLRIPTNHLRMVQDLEAHGFQLMDCLVYYEASTVDRPTVKPGNFTLREFVDADIEEVRAIARICFADYSNHYSADSRLDRGKILEGFVDWAARSCTDPAVAATVFLPVVRGKVAGFATLRRNAEAEGEGVLFAVHPQFAGQGIYGALIERGMQWCHDNGMTRMIVSTQLENLRVQRSWINRGFAPCQSFYTFHRWFS